MKLKLRIVDMKMISISVVGFVSNIILFFGYPITQPYSIFLLGLTLWGLAWLLKSKQSFLNYPLGEK